MNLEKYISIVPNWPKEGISFKDITTLMADGEAYKYATDQIVNYAKEKEIEITYKAGYDELPDWLKYEICILVNDFINSMDEEASKYKTYKIDDISYSFVDFANNKREKIESIARRIYG